MSVRDGRQAVGLCPGRGSEDHRALSGAALSAGAALLWRLTLPCTVVGPAFAEPVGEYATGTERLSDPDGIDRRGKDGVRLGEPGESQVGQRGFLEEIDPREQVSFVGFGGLEFVGFQPGKLLDDLGYCPAVLGLQDAQSKLSGSQMTCGGESCGSFLTARTPSW